MNNERSHPRLGTRRPAQVIFLSPDGHRVEIPARMVDQSEGGVALEFPAPISVGSHLLVGTTTLRGDEVREAVVCHAHVTATGDWFCGCQWVRAARRVA